MLMRTPHRWVRPKRLQPPGFIVPCQPTLADKVPIGNGWIHELKHDGFRVLAFRDGDTVRLWSRNGRDWSGEFVAITEAMRALPCKRVMLDGEAVPHCLVGLPDFHRLLGDGQSRPGAAVLGAPIGRAGRSDVPPRVRHGAGGRLEEADEPLQVGRVQELAQGEEPGL